jgi:hypothetical protein
MAGTRPITYRELYAEPTKNPFKIDDEVVEVFTRSVYELFRATGLPLEKDDLLRNNHAVFCRPIDGIGIFMPNGPPPHWGPPSGSWDTVVPGILWAEPQTDGDVRVRRRL